ncbi:MAG: hypothetical protein ACLFWI_11920 [Coleofasciculus sp.]
MVIGRQDVSQTPAESVDSASSPDPIATPQGVQKTTVVEGRV